MKKVAQVDSKDVQNHMMNNMVELSQKNMLERIYNGNTNKYLSTIKVNKKKIKGNDVYIVRLFDHKTQRVYGYYYINGDSIVDYCDPFDNYSVYKLDKEDYIHHQKQINVMKKHLMNNL